MTTYAELSPAERAQVWRDIRQDAIAMSRQHPEHRLCGPCVIGVHECVDPEHCECRECEMLRAITL